MEAITSLETITTELKVIAGYEAVVIVAYELVTVCKIDR